MNKSSETHLEYEKTYTSTTGHAVWAHISHGKEERVANLVIAKLLADWHETIWLLPTSTEPGIENPDAKIDDEIWEFKTNSTGTRNSIENGIKRGSKQADNVLLHLIHPMSVIDLENAVYDRVRQCPTLRKLRIIYKEQLYEFTRKTIVSQLFRGTIEKEKGAQL